MIYFSTKIKPYAIELAKKEPLISKEVLPEFAEALKRLQSKLKEPILKKFYHFKTLKSHILPLTNVAFDKVGTKCVTGSYDRTARIWNVEAGEEIHVLQGHENAVFSIGFNYPKWFVSNRSTRY